MPDVRVHLRTAAYDADMLLTKLPRPVMYLVFQTVFYISVTISIFCLNDLDYHSWLLGPNQESENTTTLLII